MSRGWREVARLGGAGARYPHILVDPHCWYSRLGPNYRTDEKYHSSLPLLFHGLVEHYVRRRLARVSPMLNLGELIGEVRDALYATLALCSEACRKAVLDEHVPRLEPAGGPGVARISWPAAPTLQEGVEDDLFRPATKPAMSPW